MMETALAGLWPIVWHFGLAGGLVAGLLAAAYFSPILKKDFVYAAVIVAVFAGAIAFGVNLGEKRVHAQWDAARAATLDVAKSARVGAVRDVAHKRPRWLPDRRDPNLRD